MYVTFRPLEENDAYTSWKWRNDPEVFKNTGKQFSGPIMLEDELNWIRTALARTNERRFAILADGKYIGNVNLTNITAEDAEIGIFIGEKEYWGKRIGQIVTNKIIRNAFNTLKLKRIHCIIRSEHKNAIKQCLNNGFKIYLCEEDFIHLQITANTLINDFSCR